MWPYIHCQGPPSSNTNQKKKEEKRRLDTTSFSNSTKTQKPLTQYTYPPRANIHKLIVLIILFSQPSLRVSRFSNNLWFRSIHSSQHVAAMRRLRKAFACPFIGDLVRLHLIAKSPGGLTGLGVHSAHHAESDSRHSGRRGNGKGYAPGILRRHCIRGRLTAHITPVWPAILQ